MVGFGLHMIVLVLEDEEPVAVLDFGEVPDRVAFNVADNGLREAWESCPNAGHVLGEVGRGHEGVAIDRGVQALTVELNSLCWKGHDVGSGVGDWSCGEQWVGKKILEEVWGQYHNTHVQGVGLK